MIMNGEGPKFLCAFSLGYAQVAPFFPMDFEYKLVYLQLPQKAQFAREGHFGP